MTRLWQGETVVPVTKVTVGPCRVVQIKTDKKDGYNAVQLAYGERKAKNVAKPQLKHTEGLGSFHWLREFRYNFAGRPEEKTEFDALSRGDVIDASTFAVGDMVNVVGHSKGRGFQGGVKRHGFHGHNETHGTKDQVRMPGSIGAGEPQHVFKGTRMAGRMGNEQVTVQNLEIIEVNPQDNTILIKGGLPGARNSLVVISGKGELIVNKEPVQPPPAKANDDSQEASAVTTIRDKSNDKSVINVEPIAVREEVVAETAAKVVEPVNEEATVEIKPIEIKIETPLIVETKPAEPVKDAAVKPEEKPTEPVKTVEVSKADTEQGTPASKPVEPMKAAEVSTADAGQDKTEQKPVVEEPAPAPKDKYLTMFENMSQTERKRLSSPEALAAITVLEDTYKIDVLPILAKLATKEVETANLASYLAAQYKFEQMKAEKIAAAFKDKQLC